MEIWPQNSMEFDTKWWIVIFWLRMRWWSGGVGITKGHFWDIWADFLDILTLYLLLLTFKNLKFHFTWFIHPLNENSAKIIHLTSLSPLYCILLPIVPNQFSPLIFSTVSMWELFYNNMGTKVVYMNDMLVYKIN